ncbi:MAG: replicative DNA helicase [Candidatus Saccharimonadales bacterium]
MAKNNKNSIKDVKIPPHNTDAEASLIGSILIDPEAMTKVADIVIRDDFYDKRHGLLFEAMIKLYEKRRPIDVLTVKEKLESTKSLDDVGGATYITDIANSVPTAAHADEYAQIVKSKATLRRLISAAQDITIMGYNEDEALEILLDKAEQTLFDVSQKQTRSKYVSVSDVLAESFDRLDELHRDKGKLRGLSTGFADIDRLLSGLQRSDLVVLAARPSMGKTSLALNIASHVAVKEGIPVGIFSLEMSQEQLVDRLLSAEAGVDSHKLRSGNLEDTDFEKIGDAMGTLSEAPIFIDDTPGINAMEMRTIARRMQSEHGIGLLIVDYLQLMSGRTTDNRVQEVSEISRSLKGLARELNVPLLALSQLSRGVENRTPQIPQLADLRESGSIEQDADVVMFIYREDYYNPETERQKLADILVKKHRNGPTGNIELYWQPEQLLFRSVDTRHASSVEQ